MRIESAFTCHDLIDTVTVFLPLPEPGEENYEIEGSPYDSMYVYGPHCGNHRQRKLGRCGADVLYCLMDGHARTRTELSVVAEVSPSNASVHLNRLKMAHLVKVLVQGRQRFYSLEEPDVAMHLKA